MNQLMLFGAGAGAFLEVRQGLPLGVGCCANAFLNSLRKVNHA